MLSIDDILATDSPEGFAAAAMEVFRHQSAMCAPYAEYLSLTGIDPASIDSPEKIPYLPIELFKSRDVYCGARPPEITFTSSTTGSAVPARHMMARVEDYRRVFTMTFEDFYGPAGEVSIFALLPGYLERRGSSLVYMVDSLVRASGRGGFFLRDHERLLHEVASTPGPKILLGVSYALLDLAESHPGRLADTLVMETGGMKGNRPEMPREQMHALLRDAFGVEAIHSEYGMAELTSQAYSSGGGVFRSPPWMRVSARDLNNPFAAAETRDGAARGGLNIADLANLSSCAFIQSSDMGTVFPDGSFTVAGRIAGSDIRGCNLLVQ